MSACRPLAYPYCRNKNQSTWPVFPDGKFTLDNPAQFEISWIPGTNDWDTALALCPDRDIVITACEPHVYTVYYASVYLKEDNKFTDPFGHYVKDHEYRFAGTRNAVEIVLHPKCAPHNTLQYDIGMITMEAPIMPNGPWIGFVPILATNTGLDDQDLEDEDSHLCYIAAFNELNTGMPR
ncbi:hypothetical protein GE061_011305 [Apolygus lucorum]|uniref:Uncharacterized protein n=1 Tax=Apolygus lucorum TaxID=248454 RepID=A0A8S9XY88_APOLU|nr:hypothetical protein GE061_011305 [Apolygus lucorum]